MENIWIFFILAYGILKGVRECMKKAAVKKSSVMEVLFFYMSVGFLFTLPDIKEALSLEPIYILRVFVKSVIVSVGFTLSFMAVKRLPVGLFSMLTLSQMVFTTIFGVMFLGEPFGITNFIGLFMVISGLVLVNIKKDGESRGTVKAFAVLMAVGYCFLNAISATMDKVLMGNMSSAQLQFWFMFFSSLFYGLVILVTKEKISVKTLKTNPWIILMAITLVVGDRLLFEANGHPQSRVTLMTLIMQCSVLISIVLGRVFFKEKNIIYKLLCSLIVIGGILIATL